MLTLFPDPVAFKVFGMAVHWYGISYVVSFLLCFFYAAYLLRSIYEIYPYFSPQLLDRLFSFSVLGILLGGRLGYVLFYHPSSYFSDPLSILVIWKGGMSFHGALLGMICAMVGFSRYYQVPLLLISDLISTVVPIGLFLGRIANFINQEHVGRPSNICWSVVFPRVDILSRHPSQLYEASTEGLLLFFLLIYSWRYVKLIRGAQTALFLIGYAVFRYIAECFREPDGFWTLGYVTLTIGQWLSLPMFLGGIYILIYTHILKYKKY